MATPVSCALNLVSMYTLLVRGAFDSFLLAQGLRRSHGECRCSFSHGVLSASGLMRARCLATFDFDVAVAAAMNRSLELTRFHPNRP